MRHFFCILLGGDRWHETKDIQIWNTSIRGHLFADHGDYVDFISHGKSGSELISGRRRY